MIIVKVFSYNFEILFRLHINPGKKQKLLQVPPICGEKDNDLSLFKKYVTFSTCLIINWQRQSCYDKWYVIIELYTALWYSSTIYGFIDNAFPLPEDKKY